MMVLASGSFQMPGSASAQTPPAHYYGVVEAGDEVTASIGETECGTATADASGGWSITIDGNEGSPNYCEGAVPGAVVSFEVNGETAEQTETWRGGATPMNTAEGITLSVPEGPSPDLVAEQEAHANTRALLDTANEKISVLQAALAAYEKATTPGGGWFTLVEDLLDAVLAANR